VFAYLRGTSAAPISITGNTANSNKNDGFYYEMSVDRGNMTFSGNTANNNLANGVEFRNLAVDSLDDHLRPADRHRNTATTTAATAC